MVRIQETWPLFHVMVAPMVGVWSGQGDELSKIRTVLYH